jgi:hypothetical protein
MGAKRRLMNTKTGRGSVSREVLDRYAVADPTDYPTLRFEQDRAAEQQRQARATKRAAAKSPQKLAA